VVEVEPLVRAGYDLFSVAQTPRPADAIRVGQVFLGKYQVESIIGQGGMGVVAECTHLALNERVALKMLRQDVMLDNDAVERFMREAQAAAKLRSEYVARVSDVGSLENGTPYMVMEFLEGQDLGQLVAERGKLGIPWAVELVLQTCEALAEAHSLGIVHRDVKPSNLFVTWRPDGTALIKVLDFGISKTAAGTDMQLTQTQSLLGTPAYMSPEQMRSARNVDGRTDIWSLGTVMYELIEGRKPFEAESFSEMCVKVAVDPPAPMVHAPPELQQVVLRCLAKNPDQRYSSMAELGRDLVPFTQDPARATILVERMQRMLRRSLGDWDTSGAVRTPHPAGEAGSAPVRAGTDPAAVRWAGGSEQSAPAYRTPLPGQLQAAPIPMAQVPEASAPTALPSATLDIPPPRRSRFGLVLAGAALVAAAGVAAALFVTGRTRDAASQENERATSESTTPPSDPPTRDSSTERKTDQSADAGSNEDIAPKPPRDPFGDPPTPDDLAASANQGDDKRDDKRDDKTDDKTDDRPAELAVKPTDAARGKKSGGKAKGRDGRSTQVRKTEPKDATVKDATVKDATATEPEVKCDPFANRQGCRNAK
jgi:serine/threonine protein kinase